jgi:hypothetical protein
MGLRPVIAVQQRVAQTPVLVPHPVQPFIVMQTPARKSLQSASLEQACVSEQNLSSQQKTLRSPNRAKHHEPSPTSPTHTPQGGKPFVQLPLGTPRQSLCDFLFVQRSTDAEARALVSTGAAHAAAPASPTLRSISRRVTRSGSIVHLRFVWAGSRYVWVSNSATALIAQAGAPIRTASNRWRRIRP